MFGIHAARHGTSKHSLIDPNFWTKAISARKSVSYTSVNLTGLTNPCFGQWPGGGDCSYYTATLSDPHVNLYYFGSNDGSYYTNLANSTWANWGNNGTIESTLTSGATQLWAGYAYNEYSKGTTAGAPNAPAHAYKSRFTAPWQTTAYVPSGAHPDPHPDGLMAVMQPDGSVLETLGTIILSSGNIVCASAGFFYPTVSMDGSAMGRRATMIPAHAGIVRQGEMTAQSIPHVIAFIMGTDGVLTANPVYPAFAIDSSTTYTGTSGHGVKMGQMFAIPPATNLNTAGFTTTAGRTVANALQTYGGVLVDSSSTGNWGVCSQANASDIPAYSFALATDLGIARDLCQIVASADFPF